MTTTMTIRLEPQLKGRLDRLARATQRSKSYLAAQALARVKKAWGVHEE